MTATTNPFEVDPRLRAAVNYEEVADPGADSAAPWRL